MNSMSPFVVRVDGQLVSIANPHATGREILVAAGRVPPAEYQIAQVLPNRQREFLRLEEPVDLATRGSEQFQTWKSDRTFRLFVDDIQFDWGSEKISSEDLKELAGVDPAKFDVWQEVMNGDDLPIPPGAFASLAGRSVERFFTARGSTTEGACN